MTFDIGYQELFTENPLQVKSTGSTNDGIIIINDLDKEKEKNKLKNFCANCSSSSLRNKYYGKEIDINTDFIKNAKRTIIEEGEIMVLNIKSERAEGYQFLFDKFYLPEGCRLFIYNADKTMTLGAFTNQNNRADNEFVTQFINGENVILELFVPQDTKEKIKLSIDKVVYIFDDYFISRGVYSYGGGAAACQINSSCPQGNGWENEIKSVVLILENQVLEPGTYWGGWCSGALINKENNYKDSDKPYLLTANHCYELDDGSKNDPKNWVFLFRYETTCYSDGSEIPRGRNSSVVGADIISRDEGSNNSDYMFLQLKNTVGEIRDYDVAFAGWNASSFATTENVVGIHHPAGDVKKISISYPVPISADNPKGGASNTHWKVVWDEGVTEGGSSGSPLFNANNQIIGQLQGGASYCEETYDDTGKYLGGPLQPDYYGKFDKAWTQANLTQYLAPSGT